MDDATCPALDVRSGRPPSCGGGCVGEPDASELATAHLTAEGQDAEVLYAVEQRLDAEGRILDVEEVGVLTADLQVRAARPWSHPGQPAVHSHAFDIPDGDGRRRRYELVAGDVVPEPTPPPETLELDPRLAARLEAAPPDELIPVSLFVRGVPPWDVPLLPAPGSLSAEDMERAQASRAEAIERRQQLVLELAAPLADAVVAAGGEVIVTGWGAGWLAARIPAAHLPELMMRPDLRRAALEDAVPHEAGLALGDAGAATMAGTDLFVDHGYTGERDSGRGSFGDITIAIAETDAVQDEAKFLCDTGTFCPSDSRLRKRYSCVNPTALNLGVCDPVSGYASGIESFHATNVASIAMGDYTDGQCAGSTCGDSTTSHTSAWERAASGVAREASLVFFAQIYGPVGGGTSALAETFTDAVVDGVDVYSLSNEYDDLCRVKTTTAAEAELETAYADGIFIATCSGNAASSTCTITSPSGIPSAFTVAGLAKPPDGIFGDGACADYLECNIDPGQSRLGGGTIKNHLGTSMPGSQAMVDLGAPSKLTHVTDPGGPWGEVDDNVAVTGCSFGTPYVAGSAAVMKDLFLAQGASWINAPGRLHTVMLAMGDRFADGPGGSTVQRSTGTDPKWGLGRLKMRAFHAQGGLTSAFGLSQGTVTLTTSSPTASLTINGGSPLPGGAVVLECVMHQTELLDSKDRISNVDLRIETWAPTGGSCSPQGLTGLVTDAGLDSQALVAVEGVGGKCARARLIPTGIHAGGVTVHAFCCFAGVDDEDPN